MSTRFSSAAQLLAAQGLDLGVTEWLEMTQARVNLFAEATGDRQWIHVDPARAASGPFGACIAHGYLTLTPGVEFQYMVDAYYAPGHERGLRWNDPGLGIDWPVAAPVLADRDKTWPLLKDLDSPFVFAPETAAPYTGR